MAWTAYLLEKKTKYAPLVVVVTVTAAFKTAAAAGIVATGTTLADEDDLATITGTFMGAAIGAAATITTAGAGVVLTTTGTAFSTVFTVSISTEKSSFIEGSESPNSSSSKAA